MPCFTLASYAYIGPNRPDNVPLSVYPLRYPKAVAGIRLDPIHRCVSLRGLLRIPASEELLHSADQTAVQRSGSEITVLRASLEGKDSELKLVPEKPEDAGKATVLVDLIGAPSLRFEPTAGQIPMRAVHMTLGLVDEIALAVLEPFKPLRAVRYGKVWRQKGMRLWRESVDGEVLSIQYDGTTIFYDLKTGAAAAA